MTRRLLVAAWVLCLPALALGEEWKGVPLVDRTCAGTARTAPDDHPRDCILQCAGSGLGIIDHGAWLRLDDAGTAKALSLLRSARREDHVRVDVSGERTGGTIRVESLALTPL
jgi:hypothetical protein